ncbi:Unknown protein, partial [Striga hermonthica]
LLFSRRGDPELRKHAFGRSLLGRRGVPSLISPASRRDAGSIWAQEARAVAAAAMPPPPPPNPTLGQGGTMAQGGVPPQAAVQAPCQQMVAMTREEMQRIAAATAAQAVQQVTSHTSHATTAPTTVAGSQDEDVSSYGEGEELEEIGRWKVWRSSCASCKTKWRGSQRRELEDIPFRGRFSLLLCQTISRRPTW